MAINHKQELLGENGEVLYSRIDVCYARIGSHIVKLKPTHIRTHWPECLDNWPINKFTAKELTKYVKAVDSFLKIKENHETLAKEMAENHSFTVSTDRTAFECVSICTALRYVWEQSWIPKAFLKIKEVSPKCSNWKALLLAHDYKFCNDDPQADWLLTGHSLIQKSAPYVHVDKKFVNKTVFRAIERSTHTLYDQFFGLNYYRNGPGIQNTFDQFVKLRNSRSPDYMNENVVQHIKTLVNWGKREQQ